MSLKNNKFITAKVLLSEMSSLITKTRNAFKSNQLHILWSLAVKSGNEGILCQIYELWRLTSNAFQNGEQEHFNQLCESYDVKTNQVYYSSCSLLYHALRLGILEQVKLILQYSAKFYQMTL